MKKNMKRFVSLFLILTLSLTLLTSCGGNNENTETSGETTVLKVGHAYGDTYPMHTALQQMSDTIYEKTEGRYKLDIHPNSQLGGEIDLIEGVSLGTVDMCFTATTPLANTVPSLAELDLPFLIEDYDHADAVFFDENSEVRNMIVNDIDNAGFKTLALCENGFRQLVTNKPIESIEDIEGLKVRVMENQLHLELWNALGASPTTMAGSEALTAIQQGTVDAVEMFHSAIISAGFAELVDYYARTNHIYTCGALLLSVNVWNNMSAEDQAIFTEAANEVAATTNAELRATDDANYEALVGDTYGLKEGKVDIEALKEMTQVVYDKHPEYADFVAKVQALAE